MRTGSGNFGDAKFADCRHVGGCWTSSRRRCGTGWSRSRSRPAPDLKRRCVGEVFRGRWRSHAIDTICAVLTQHGITIASPCRHAAEARSMSAAGWADAHTANTLLALLTADRSFAGERDLVRLAARDTGRPLVGYVETTGGRSELSSTCSWSIRRASWSSQASSMTCASGSRHR